MSKPVHLDELFKELLEQQRNDSKELPPVESWDPDLCGELDIRIDREGRWYYQDGPIERASLVRLFSTIIKREGDEYFLVTPAEKWRIQVDVAPFVAVSLEAIVKEDQEVLRFELNEGSHILLTEADGFWMQSVATRQEGEIEELPFIRVRDSLPALLHRNVFYELINLSHQRDNSLYFSSFGHEYCLGAV